MKQMVNQAYQRCIKLYHYLLTIGFWSWFLGLFNQKRKVENNDGTSSIQDVDTDGSSNSKKGNKCSNSRIFKVLQARTGTRRIYFSYGINIEFFWDIMRYYEDREFLWDKHKIFIN